MAKMDTSGVHVWLVLWKACRAVEAHALHSIESLGLCQSDFAVLELLLHKGPMPVNALGKKVLLTSGSCTTAVDRLEARGLVERTWGQEDRRVCLVCLTPAGRRLITGAFGDHARAMERAAAGLARAERETLLTLLKKLGLTAQAAMENEVHMPPAHSGLKQRISTTR
ncbi:MAG TPA: MarR family transcriptional regulator [Gemmataceae bacterium]|nr:MarR family transcriptional regulator [Gemmataceae bacterium]